MSDDPRPPQDTPTPAIDDRSEPGAAADESDVPNADRATTIVLGPDGRPRPRQVVLAADDGRAVSTTASTATLNLDLSGGIANAGESAAGHSAAGHSAAGHSAAGHSAAGDEADASDEGGELLRVGEYELLAEIAHGGMGVVYRAEHRTLRRVAAVKMILGGRFSSAETQARFRAEAEAAARLDHPAIVPIYEIGHDRGQTYFAMRLVEGGSLAELMEECSRDLKRGVKLLELVARGVEHAHQRGILHRDLKPANILLNDDGTPAITDFGLAKNTTSDANMTATGVVVGTPAYMSPEQAAGDHDLTTRSDVYSLGAILYEMLTGKPPHEGATPVDVLMSVRQTTPPRPRASRAHLDPDLELICLKATAREPAERYASAEALADDLAAWQAGLPISAKPPSLAAMSSQWIRQNRRLLLIGGLMMLAAVISLPVGLLAVVSGNVGDLNVYANYFPEASPPWLTRGRSLLPLLQPVVFLLYLVLWPSFGYWIAAATRPQTHRQAIGVAFVASAIGSVLVFLAIGWLFVAAALVNDLQPRVQTLGDALWHTEEVVQYESGQRAVATFAGLEAVDGRLRGRVLADRLWLDSLANAVWVPIRYLWASLYFGLTVIIGTVLAAELQRRRGSRYLSTLIRLVRYFLAFVGAVVLVYIAVFYLEGAVRSKLQFDIWLVHLAASLIAAALLFLTMRRWVEFDRWCAPEDAA